MQDPVSIDALADALQAFKGGVVLVSHDFRLISKVSKEIWEVRHGQVHRWEGYVLSWLLTSVSKKSPPNVLSTSCLILSSTISEYKEKLRKNMTKHLAENMQKFGRSR